MPYSAVDIIMSEISNIDDLTEKNLVCCMKKEVEKFKSISECDRNETLKNRDKNFPTIIYSLRYFQIKLCLNCII